MSRIISRYIFLMLICLPVTGSAQRTLIWQGFEQNWGYNHRLNRLGDWVQPLPDGSGNWEWIHTAASGSGADVATFGLHALWLEVPGMEFETGAYRFEIKGKEGDSLSGSHRIAVPRRGDHTPIPILNGFDLCTLEGYSADKPGNFSIRIKEEETDSGDSLIFVLSYSLQFYCSTFECPKFNQKLGYSLKIFWQVLHLPELQGSRYAYVFQGREWTKKDTLVRGSLSNGVREKSNQTLSAYPIQGLSFYADKEFHFRRLSSYLKGYRYPSTYTYGNHLMFEAWHPEMYDAFKELYEGKIRPPAKWTVKRSEGTAEIKMELREIMLQEGSWLSPKASGSIHWHTAHGKQASPQGPDAEFHLEIKPPE